MTPEEAQQLLTFWQTALRMRDWTIKLSLVSPEEMSDPDYEGSCVYSERGYAWLKVVASEHRQSETSTPDTEVLIVHEMLHPYLDFGADEGTAEWRAQEFAIERIARALVELRRGRV